MRKLRMVQCATQVNKDAIRRESIGGVEHVIVSSFTMPDDIVMNGGLYPAEEIAKSFASLEGTLAPIEHPTSLEGMFISATDAHAIHNFHAGASNTNVTQQDGRIHIEKRINVQEALKTERGKRLMDRVNELETNDKPRPIHTSTGIFLEVEEIAEPKTNAHGDEFTWIARNMFFDHDAILLDSVGAAQPSQGVGMAVNSQGKEVEVEVVVLNSENTTAPPRPEPKDMRTNAEGRSFESITADLHDAITGIFAMDWMSVHRVFDNAVVFETSQGFFEVPWSMTNDSVELTGLPISVDKKETFTPKTNASGGVMVTKQMIINSLGKLGIQINGALADRLNNLLNQRSDDDDERSDLIDRMASAAGIERDTLLKILSGDIETPPEDRLRGFAEVLGVSLESLKTLVDNKKGEDKMKDLILNALAEAGIKTEGLSDEDLIVKYNELQAVPPVVNTDNSEAIVLAVAEAIKPLTEQIESLKSQVTANSDKERSEMETLVVSSDKYEGLDEAGAKALPLETLKTMAANCGTAHGVPLHVNQGGADDTYKAPTDMPE